MKYFLIAMLVLTAPAICLAGSGDSAKETLGVGYLAKTDGTKIYEQAEGDAAVTTVNRDFPMVAYESNNEWLGIMAAESVKNGRAHVRYYKNGQNGKEGEKVAWVDLKDVKRIYFDCCGDNAHCSGIQDSLFKTAVYTDCFTRARETAIGKKAPPAGKVTTDLELEKLKIQLEIEKLKLEQERIKAGIK